VQPSSDFIRLIESNARLETKIDLVLQRLDRQDEDIDAIRGRVEDLEKSRAHSRGIVAALTAIGGAIGGIASTAMRFFLSS
jgi:hypothetical protein